MEESRYSDEQSCKHFKDRLEQTETLLRLAEMKVEIGKLNLKETNRLIEHVNEYRSKRRDVERVLEGRQILAYALKKFAMRYLSKIRGVGGALESLGFSVGIDDSLVLLRAALNESLGEMKKTLALDIADSKRLGAQKAELQHKIAMFERAAVKPNA
jgi:hypothetical protein